MEGELKSLSGTNQYGTLEGYDEEIDPAGWKEELATLTVDQLRSEYSWRTANYCFKQSGEPVMASAAKNHQWDLLLYLVDLHMPDKAAVVAVVEEPSCPLLVFETVVGAWLAKYTCPYCNEAREDCDHADLWLVSMFDPPKRQALYRDQLANQVCERYHETVEAKSKVAALLSLSGMSCDALLELMPLK